MGPIDQLTSILPEVCDLVDRIEPGQLTAPTPCERFDVHGVLDHMITLGGSFAYLFRGEEPPPTEAPAVYGRVPATEFRTAMTDLLDAIRSDGALDRKIPTALGTMDGETFARLVAFDGLVHGWDLAAATAVPYRVDPDVVTAVAAFAHDAISDDLRDGDRFKSPTEAPGDASPIERLAAFSGRTVENRWRRSAVAIHIDKDDVPVRIDVPGARARQIREFGDATGYGTIAGEYFSMGAGTDIAPLLRGLHHDTCHAPHWGYLISGKVDVTFVGGGQSTCVGGEIFYWPPGHSVSVVEDTEVVLFSPQHEHVEVMDHMLEVMAAG